MKIKYLALTTLLAASPLATAVTADTGMYVGGDVSRIQMDDDGFGTFDINALVVKGGYRFNPNFALEARIGTGVSDETRSIYDDFIRLDGEVSLSHMVGVYGRLTWPINETYSVYGLVGVTQTKFDVDLLVSDHEGNIDSGSGNLKDTDVSFGAGLDININHNWAVQFEYARLLDETGYSVNGLSIGATYRF